VKALLAIRALFFVALLPGTIAGYVPYLILLSSHELHLPPLSASAVAASLLILAGTLILLRCVWDFFATGKGTLAPVDPPRHLVVAGLYRYTRNPMYNGVLAILLGQAWFFSSASILTYAGVVFVAFHLFVIVYEEPTLEEQFRESYQAYRQSVPRWGFTSRPYKERTGSTA
jgi:protein-S-isoprenylcysteine O-methyltransferase Ste14